jgi:hypothetical protein
MRRRAGSDHDQANLSAAEVILQDPARYPAGSGLEQWARLVMSRKGDSREPEPTVGQHYKQVALEAMEYLSDSL